MSFLIDLIIITFCGLVLYYLYQGAIFLPTHPKTVTKIVELANIKPGMKTVDLGSGDGRLVIALAQAGSLADGFEINPVLALWSKIKIKKTGISNTRIFTKSFWHEDLSQYEVVVVFGMTHIMDRLENKLTQELRENTIVISNIFKFSGLREVSNNEGVYVYRVYKMPQI